MAAQSRLGRQMEQVIATLRSIDAPFALIGGLALASHKVVRGTQDIDLLVAAVDAERIAGAFLGLQFQCLHRSPEAANFLRGDERVDFLFASRPIALRLLADAPELTTAFGAMRVVSAEGIIGLKLQAFVNNPRRTQDLEDIRALLRANRGALNLGEIAEYFRLFERESLLEGLLRE